MRFLWNLLDLLVWTCVVFYHVAMTQAAMWGVMLSQGPSPVPGAVLTGGFYLIGWHWFRFMTANEKGIAPTRELAVFPALLTAIYVIALIALYLL